MRIIIYIAIAVVAVAIMTEVSGWLKGSKLIGKAQKAYRLSAAVTLEALLFMFLFGKAISGHNPLFQIGYWGFATALTFLLVALGLLDVKATLTAYREQRKEMFRDLVGKERQKE